MEGVTSVSTFVMLENVMWHKGNKTLQYMLLLENNQWYFYYYFSISAQAIIFCSCWMRDFIVATGGYLRLATFILIPTVNTGLHKTLDISAKKTTFF